MSIVRNINNVTPLTGDEVRHLNENQPPRKPNREEAEAAVKTLLAWAGDDPTREGLIDTPKRVAKAFDEYFGGYKQDPIDILSRTFREVEGYDDIVLLKDIRFESHCEHHMAPIVGKVHVAYLPSGRVVGISKMARIVNAFAKRLQVQEKLTAQISNAMEEALQPRGVAVYVEAEHHCMKTRGVHKDDVSMVTCKLTGLFKDDDEKRQILFHALGQIGQQATPV